MPWEVDPDLIVDWLVALDQKSYELVIAALELLEERGPSLGRPVVDSVRGSRHANMKELRPGSSGRSELRVLFAFDPDRRAVLLVGGDKSGAWSEWYRSSIPLADERLDRHIAVLRRKDK
jgi:hypothetical protein